MREPQPIIATTHELLDWLREDEYAGALTASTVALLANVIHGQKIVYRESALESGDDFVKGTITIFLEHVVCLAKLHQVPGGLGSGHVTVDVLARSALRHLQTDGSERMAALDEETYDKIFRGPDTGVRELRLTLTYEDGTREGRQIVLEPSRRFRSYSTLGPQAPLISTLLADLAR